LNEKTLDNNTITMAVVSWKNCHQTEKKVLGRRVINVVRKKPPRYLEISVSGLRKIVRFIVVYMRNELARIVVSFYMAGLPDKKRVEGEPLT
jgi:hypothetical protein